MPVSALAEADESTLAVVTRSDPAWWVREVLGAEPWAKQVAILESIRDNPRTAVRSGHGVGKSFIAARAVLWYLYAHPYSVVVTTAPTGRQVRKILWAELRQAFGAAKVPLGGTLLQTELNVDDKWFAFGFSTDDGDSFQGPHAEHALVVLDEASGVDPDLWVAIDGILTSEHCRFLAIGNPTDPTGRFAQEFKTAGTKKIHISVFDTPNFTAFGITIDDIRNNSWQGKIGDKPLPYPALTTPSWVADKFKRWGEGSPLWDARVMGNFPAQGSDTLIPLTLIEKAQARTLEAKGANELGVDVARFGEDETVIAHRRGPVVRLVHVGARQDTMETTGHVVLQLRETGADVAKVDDVGLGGGVTDRLVELQEHVAPVNVGMAANDPERFANLRAELWWNLRERFREADIDIPPDDDDLAAQLASVKYKLTSKGQIQIESKADAKKRGVPSPDRGDAVVLAFAPSPGVDLEALARM